MPENVALIQHLARLTHYQDVLQCIMNKQQKGRK